MYSRCLSGDHLGPLHFILIAKGVEETAIYSLVKINICLQVSSHSAHNDTVDDHAHHANQAATCAGMNFAKSLNLRVSRSRWLKFWVCQQHKHFWLLIMVKADVFKSCEEVGFLELSAPHVSSAWPTTEAHFSCIHQKRNTRKKVTACTMCIELKLLYMKQMYRMNWGLTDRGTKANIHTEIRQSLN